MYVESRKKVQLNLVPGQEQRRSCRDWSFGEGKVKGGEPGDPVWRTCTAVCEADSWWGPVAEHRQLSSVPCDDPEGWDGEVGGRLPREGIETNTAGKAIILQWKRFFK